jgi:hypothetical protein
MATDATDESAVGSEGRSVVCWTTSMSTFMLKHLCAIVEGGARTSTGFKMMHYNGCARALNEHFRQSLTGAQISNHHRTIKKKFAMIQKIKDTVSGAQWDDETSTIRLEHEMAINYIAKHKAAAEFINRPIENYREMQIIYGDRLATGKYAKGSSEPIGTAATAMDCDDDDEAVLAQSNNEGTSATRPVKKHKKDPTEEEGLVSILGRVGSELAAAIITAGEKSAPQPPVDEIPDALYETLLGMEGFSEAQIAHYFAFLVENPKSAKAFMKMGHTGQQTWMARYINKEWKD